LSKPAAKKARDAAKATASTPDRPTDTRGQQIATRYVMWLGAAFGLALAVAGIWLLATCVNEARLMPLRAGLGLVLSALGSAAFWAGLYAARHCQLEAGRLKFDPQAHALLVNPMFGRALKWGGHAIGITVLAVSWLSVYYPNGIALQ